MCLNSQRSPIITGFVNSVVKSALNHSNYVAKYEGSQ